MSCNCRSMISSKSRKRRIQSRKSISPDFHRVWCGLILTMDDLVCESQSNLSYHILEKRSYTRYSYMKK